MSEFYNFDFKVVTNKAGAIVAVDRRARYGYWEHSDGSEGGGLWFGPAPGGLELNDFDGDFHLPKRVIAALREGGFFVPADFE